MKIQTKKHRRIRFVPAGNHIVLGTYGWGRTFAVPQLTQQMIEGSTKKMSAVVKHLEGVAMRLAAKRGL